MTVEARPDGGPPPHDPRPPDPMTLVIVDDHARFRQATVAALSSDPGIHVLGEGGCATSAVTLACTLRPDVILLDITMPGNGLSAARILTALCPALKIVMLTFSADEDDLRDALASGVHGYILKGVGGRDLRRIMHAVHAGERYIAPELRAVTGSVPN